MSEAAIVNPDKPAIARRKRRHLPRRVMYLAIAVSSLPTLAVIIAFPVTNLLVNSKWHGFRAEWESQGEIFDLDSLLSPPVPDAQNFAKCDLIAECFRPQISPRRTEGSIPDNVPDNLRLRELSLFSSGEFSHPKEKLPRAYTTGIPIDLASYLPDDSTRSSSNAVPADRIHEIFATHREVLAELMTAANLPEARFDVNLNAPSRTPVSHLPPLIEAMHSLRLRNLMLIESGAESADEAAESLIRTLRLIRLATASEGFVSHTIRVKAFDDGGLDVTWQALFRQRFTDSQWQRIDREFRAFEFGPELLHALRFERAALVREVERGFERRSSRPFSVPPAWVNLSGLMDYAALTQRFWFTDAANGRTLSDGPSLPQLAAIEAKVAKMPTNFTNLIIAAGVLPIHDFAVQSRQIEAQRDHALIAIALERYRLAHGALPDHLSQLIPEFLPELPTSPATGQPPRYERASNPDDSAPAPTGYRLRGFGDETGAGDPFWVMPAGGIQ
ncbi:MAG: hypothetical protein KDN19_11975 [Verrucomicrobiae bacterium]|nr:hypothetical protein [Verrucomicrobiae bacterium]